MANEKSILGNNLDSVRHYDITENGIPVKGSPNFEAFNAPERPWNDASHKDHVMTHVQIKRAQAVFLEQKEAREAAEAEEAARSGAARKGITRRNFLIGAGATLLGGSVVKSGIDASQADLQISFNLEGEVKETDTDLGNPNSVNYNSKDAINKYSKLKEAIDLVKDATSLENLKARLKDSWFSENTRDKNDTSITKNMGAPEGEMVLAKALAYTLQAPLNNEQKEAVIKAIAEKLPLNSLDNLIFITKNGTQNTEKKFQKLVEDGYTRDVQSRGDGNAILPSTREYVNDTVISANPPLASKMGSVATGVGLAR